MAQNQGIGARIGDVVKGVMSRVASPVKTMMRAPYLWMNYGGEQPHWQMIDYGSFARDGFQRNALIYAALMYKIRAVGMTRLMAYRGEQQQPNYVTRHPLADLLLRPNAHQSWLEFEALNTLYLNIAGNAYVMLDRKRGGDVPIALYPLRPDRVRIVPKEGGIKGYLYLPDGVNTSLGVPLLPQDVIHVKYSNPLDDLEGMGYGQSPLRALAQSGDVDNNITSYLKLFMERGAMPSGLLKFNVPLDDAQLGQIRRRWSEIYGGVDNWSDVGVLDSGGEYQRLSLTMSDMGFDSLDERNEARILSALGVPSVLIDSRLGSKASTYNNKQEARRAFWEDTMMYELALWDAEYAHYLGTDEVSVMRDLSRVPALQKNVPDLVGAAHTMWSMGVPAATAFATVGLRVEDLHDGDVGYVPANVVRVGDTPGSETEVKGWGGVPHDDRDDGTEAAFESHMRERDAVIIGQEFKAWTDAQKRVLGLRVDAIAQGYEAGAMEAVGEALGRDLRAIGAILHGGQTKALERKASIAWEPLFDDVKRYLAEDAPQGWRDSFVPILRGVVADVGEHWAAETGLAFNVRQLLGEAWFADYTLVFSQPINQTTSDSIQRLLAAGQAEGWSILKMQDNLEALFKQWMDGDMSPSDFAWLDERMPPYRREMIARTETIRAANAGSQELFKQWGIEKREWLATADARTRPTHKAASGQVRPIGEAFEVGGYRMMHPGDGGLGADVREIVNCRCTILPIIE